MTAKSFKLASLYILLAALVSSAAAEQAQQSEREKRYTDYFRPISPLPPDLAFTNHHASTALEGSLRGQAQLVHASGNFWLSVAQAMICREHARTLSLDNLQQWLLFKAAVRKSYESDRQRRTSNQKQANDARRTERNAVHRLQNDQVNRATGEIIWPVALEVPAYSELRERLNQLFRVRVEYGDASVANVQQITYCTHVFSEKLLRDRFAMTRSDYIAAQKFLCGLKYEFELPSSSEPRLVASTDLVRRN